MSHCIALKNPHSLCDLSESFWFPNGTSVVANDMNLPNAVLLVMCNWLYVFVSTAKSNIFHQSFSFSFLHTYIYTCKNLIIIILFPCLLVYMGVGEREDGSDYFFLLLQIWSNLECMVDPLGDYEFFLVNNDKKKHQLVELDVQWWLKLLAFYNTP